MKNIFLILAIFMSTGFLAFGANFTDDLLQFGKPGSNAPKDITFGASNKKKLSHVPASGTLTYNDNNFSVGDGLNSANKTIVLNKGVSSTTIKHNFSSGALEIENANVVSQKGNELHLGDGTNSNKVLKFNKGASSPEIRYNSGTQKLEFSNDAANYKAIGSGGGGGSGGLNLISTNPDFEANVTTDWVVSGTTVSQGSYTVPSTDNAKYASITATVAGQFYETIPYQVTDVLDGGDCELNYNYQNTVGSWRAEIYTSASTTALVSRTIVSTTNWKEGEKIFFPCGTPASATVKVRYTNLVSGTLNIDDVYLGKIRSLKTGAIVEQEQSCAFTAANFGATNVDVKCWRVGDKIKGRGHFRVGAPTAGLAILTFPPGIEIDLAKQAVNQSHIFGVWVRGIDATQVAMAANTVGPRVMVATTGVPNSLGFATLSNANGGANPSANFTVQAANAITAANDQISFEFEFPVKGGSGSGTTFDSVCPNDIACQDSFPFKVSAAGVVSEEYLDIVNGNCGVAGNAFTCTWNPQVFPQGVTCVGTENGGGANQSVSTAGGNSTNLTYTTTLNGGATALATSWVCHRTNSVVKRTVEGYLSKTVNHSGLLPLKISTGFFGQGTSTTICTSSPCGIFSSSGDVASIPRVTTGSIQLVFNAGVWTSPPACDFTVRTTAANTNIYPSLVSTSTTVYEVRFTDANNSGTDSYGHFTCTGF